MYIEQSIKVKSSDTDYIQIVNNTVYVKWFEDLWIAILDKYFPLEEMFKENNSPILTETYVKYIKPLTIKNHPIGRAWIEKLERSTWVACFEIVENDIIYCEGKQTGYYFNMDRMRPVRFPENVLENYKRI